MPSYGEDAIGTHGMLLHGEGGQSELRGLAKWKLNASSTTESSARLVAIKKVSAGHDTQGPFKWVSSQGFASGS